MSYFSGEYECKMDSKGRMVLPAKLKSALPEGNGDKVVVARGFEPCLTLYPMDEWTKIFDKVASLNEFNPEYRSFQRNFLRGSSELDLDASSRILIPKNLLKHAEIEDEVILVGMGNRLEIWNPAKYDEFLIKDQAALSQMAMNYLGKDANTGNQ